MRAVLSIFTVICLLSGSFEKAVGQCPSLAPVVPDSLCSNALFEAEQVGAPWTHAQWLFGQQEIDSLASPDNLGDLSGSVSSATYGINVLPYDGNYIGFVKISNAKALSRLEFGSSLDNTPTATSVQMNSFSQDNSISDGDVDVIRRNGEWYGFTTARGGNSLIRYHFGDSLTNDTIVAVTIGNPNSQLSLPFAVDVDTLQDSIYLTVASWSNNSVVIYNWGTDIEAASPVWHKTISLGSTSPSISNTSGIATHYTCDKKVIFTCGYSSNNVLRLNLGNSFQNTATIETINESTNLLPNSLILRYDRGVPELFGKSRTTGQNIFHYIFNDSIDEAANAIEQRIYTDFASTMRAFSLDLEYTDEGAFFYVVNNSGTAYRMYLPIDDVGGQNQSFLPSASVALTTPGNVPYGLYAVDAVGNLRTYNNTVFLRTAPTITGYDAEGFCLGDTLKLEADESSGISGLSWEWLINGQLDTSATAEAEVAYTSPGTFPIQVSAGAPNGCVDSFSFEVVTHGLPDASFVADSSCQGVSALITNTSTLYPTDTSATYIWSSVDTVVGANPNLVYGDSGSFAIQLNIITQSGCMDSTRDTIYIKPAPVAAFDVFNTCLGDTTTFTNLSGSTTTYTSLWDLGDSTISTANSPSHIYLDTGVYHVTLLTSAANGCSTDTGEDVVVTTPPVAGLTLLTAPLCSDQAIEVADASVFAAPLTRQTLAVGSDTFSLPPMEFQTAQLGSLSALYTVVSGSDCAADTAFSIHINDTPDLNYTNDPLCQSDDVRFEATAEVNDSQSILSYLWDFSDNQQYFTDSIQRSFTLAGSYTVSITVNTDSGCVETLVEDLQIMQDPSVVASLESPYCTSAELIRSAEVVIDPLDSVDALVWYMIDANGDSTSYSSSQEIIPEASGQFDVFVELITAEGCVRTDEQSITIEESPEAFVADDSVCVGNGVTLQANYSGSNYSYLWQWPTNQSAGLETVQLIPGKTGILPVRLTITNTVTGCQGRDTSMVYVAEGLQLSLMEETWCLNAQDTVHREVMLDSMDEIDGYRWYVNDVLAGTTPFLITSFSEADPTVELTVTTAIGCEASVSTTLPTYAGSDASFQTNELFGTTPFEIEARAVTPQVAHHWIIGNDTLGGGRNFAYTLTSPSNRALIHAIVDSNGCIATSSKALQIYSGGVDLAVTNTRLLGTGPFIVEAIFSNVGAVPVRGFQAGFTFLNGVMVQTEVDDTLDVGEAIVVRSEPITLQDPDLEGYCALVVELNGAEDSNPSNDRSCGTLSEGAFHAYPNPASDVVMLPISLDREQRVIVQVFHSNGALVQEGEIRLKEGYHEIPLHVRSYGSGVYYVDVVADRGQSYRIIVSR